MHAISLARDQHARITLLTVGPSVNRSTAVGTAPPPDLIDIHKEVLHDATALIPRDVGVTTRLERGEAAATILRIAREEEDDLIVMGSHGHSRFHRALLGSVSEKVLAQSEIPVLLMRGNGCAEPPVMVEEPTQAEAEAASSS
jgi:nucleotide-binding universal stress UspA family protein